MIPLEEPINVNAVARGCIFFELQKTTLIIIFSARDKAIDFLTPNKNLFISKPASHHAEIHFSH